MGGAAKNSGPDSGRLPSMFTLLWTLRHVLLGLALISGVVNVLYLAGSMFMLEVYDRVLPGRSIPTLVGLLVFLGVLYLFQAILEIVRTRALVRLGSAAVAGMGSNVFRLSLTMALAGQPGEGAARPAAELENIRRFIAGPGPSALFDLPWIPIYLALCFAFHPMIGMTALVGAVIIVSLTLFSDVMTASLSTKGRRPATLRDDLAQKVRRNAEVVTAMGMAGRLEARWQAAATQALSFQQKSADVTGGLGVISKIFRMALQSLVLAVGAYLVIEGQASAGVMIASSVLTSRALAPVEQSIANWRSLVSARQAWAYMVEAMAAKKEQKEPMSLARPRAHLTVERLTAGAPNADRVILNDISFALSAGDGVGIIGPSGSGKSSLARSLVGIWPVQSGTVRLDGAALQHWNEAERGNFIGYLPQDIELFSGSIADNIARFADKPDADAIVAAAKEADVHELILRFPGGYDAEVGEFGAMLSAGQKQRIGLARALYGRPFLVVLDEPNSNLDAEGEAALTEALKAVRARGGIAVVIAHRPSALAALDHVLIMVEGRVSAFGSKAETLARVLRQPEEAHTPAFNPAERAWPGQRIAS
jgi:ATP-binding cassette subfamily C protein